MHDQILAVVIKIGIGFYDSNYQHYAFAFHKNQLIEYGINYILNNQNIHAEHNLLHRLYKKHKTLTHNITIYSIRFNKQGDMLNGQCCKNCMRRIQLAFKKNIPIHQVCWSNQGQIQNIPYLKQLYYAHILVKVILLGTIIFIYNSIKKI